MQSQKKIMLLPTKVLEDIYLNNKLFIINSLKGNYS